MSTESKPSIVSAHGPWADGSCFNKVMGPLRAEGYEVIASEHGLDSHAGGVDCVLRSLGRVSSPAILVGHSYGGSLITAAGTDDRVVGLVYIAALAPDETETSQSQQEKFPPTHVADLFNQKVDGVAWRTKPSAYIVASRDRTVNPELERSAAERMGATTYEVESSHVPMLSRPDVVLEAIRNLVTAV
jgi:pimeloyl-ACP methyl ester carboxylesterase